MGGDGHFFHDMIEGIIIWEDSDSGPEDAPVRTPIEATEDSIEADPIEHDVDASGLDASHGYAVDGTAPDGPVEG